jgi:IgGFc binding protein
MPLATRLNGDTFRILASFDSTNVLANGAPVAMLNRGQFDELIITGPAQISADQPVLVAQYSNGSSFDDVTSNPFMMLIPPFEQFLASYTVTTQASGFSTNFINIVAPAAAVGAITLDGTAIPPSTFAPTGTCGLLGAQVPVPSGSHTFLGPLPFGVFVYGFTDFDSYGYPGGMSLAPVVIVANLTLTPETATNPVGTERCVVATVSDQSANPVPGIRVISPLQESTRQRVLRRQMTVGRRHFALAGSILGRTRLWPRWGLSLLGRPRCGSSPSCTSAMARTPSLSTLWPANLL